MKVIIGFVLLVVGAVSANMADECEMAMFYTDLGCTSVARTDGGLCPQAFTCPDLHPDPTKCYYRGVSYNYGSSIPEESVSNPCIIECVCKLPYIECPAVDCVETFDNDMQEQCIYTGKLDSCCSTGTVCGKDAIAELKTCEVDGKTYREGQSYTPKNTRKNCICTADFNATDITAYCRDVPCDTEIHFQSELMKNCAPVFYGDMMGCPIEFECPSSETKVVRGLNIRNLTGQCVFGNMTLTVGDEVTVQDTCTKCTCAVPPFVSCKKTNC